MAFRHFPPKLFTRYSYHLEVECFASRNGADAITFNSLCLTRVKKNKYPLPAISTYITILLHGRRVKYATRRLCLQFIRI